MPVLGRVAAGEPLLAEENIEDYVQIPDIAGGEDGEYLLRVRGESMKNAGILPDDWVVVRRQDTAEDGEIVVALVGEEATVKRFFKEADHVRLQPENETMEPIRSREVRGARPGRRSAEEGRIMSALMAERRELGEDGRQDVAVRRRRRPPRAPEPAVARSAAPGASRRRRAVEDELAPAARRSRRRRRRCRRSRRAWCAGRRAVRGSGDATRWASGGCRKPRGCPWPGRRSTT